MPPAKDNIPGWSSSFNSSRISDAFIRPILSANFILIDIWAISLRKMIPSFIPYEINVNIYDL